MSTIKYKAAAEACGLIDALDHWEICCCNQAVREWSSMGITIFAIQMNAFYPDTPEREHWILYLGEKVFYDNLFEARWVALEASDRLRNDMREDLMTRTIIIRRGCDSIK